MNTFLTIVAIVVLAIVGFFFYQGYVSKTGSAPGLVDGKLSKCPDKPNCVCTEYADDSEHFAEPIRGLGQTAEEIANAVRATGGTVVDQTMDGENVYTSARYTSSIFRFVDDVEFRTDVSAGVLHVRSASRVGHSDLGANAKRFDAIRKALGSGT